MRWRSLCTPFLTAAVSTQTAITQEHIQVGVIMKYVEHALRVNRLRSVFVACVLLAEHTGHSETLSEIYISSMVQNSDT